MDYQLDNRTEMKDQEISVVLTAIRLIVLLLINLFISISDSESCFYSCCFASIYNDYISYVKNLEKN